MSKSGIRKGTGRHNFVLIKDEVSKLIDEGLTIKAIYNNYKNENFMSYIQFWRYITGHCKLKYVKKEQKIQKNNINKQDITEKTTQNKEQIKTINNENKGPKILGTIPTTKNSKREILSIEDLT